MIALIINSGAYSCESVRAGIEAVHKSQIESGMSLALTPFQVFRCVVLPPALQTVYPALASQFVLVMLATSLASAISAEELTSIANTIQSQSFRSLEVYTVTAGLYLLLAEIGRASCRERVCPYVSISVVAGSLKKKNKQVTTNIKTE